VAVLKDKTIVLGVSGGIAAYKSAELVRLLAARGARVRVMMTRNATEFITPLTLQTLSTNPVATDTFSLTQESEIGHIRLADTADAIVIAPATADVIARAAVGIADDLVTTVLLAARCPIAFAPAMNVHMYEHPTVAENLARLRARNITIIEPDEGELACGYEGKGRLPDLAAIVEELERMLSRHDLAAERMLVTAGPTREVIDPVRFVSNHSSGKMGFAIARAAWRRGASVRLIAGPTALKAPPGIERIDAVSAAEMLAATGHNFPWCSTLVMAAAVADFKPAAPARNKIKKSVRPMTLEMRPIADEHAIDKLRRKKLDLIIANDVTVEGAGFGSDTNIVTIIGTDGRPERHPKLSKDEVADVILDRLVHIRAASIPRRANRSA
jgi:phosphopantothenoylcysteine decarboxylase/phosphopantothenate--cysteine ligase